MRHNIVQGINKNEETRGECQKSKQENVDYRPGSKTVGILPLLTFWSASEISFAFGLPANCLTSKPRLSIQVPEDWDRRKGTCLPGVSAGSSRWEWPSSDPGCLCAPNAGSKTLHIPASRRGAVALRSLGVWLYWPCRATRTDDRPKGGGGWSTASVYDATCQIQVCYLEMKWGGNNLILQHFQKVSLKNRWRKSSRVEEMLIIWAETVAVTKAAIKSWLLHIPKRRSKGG